MSERCDVVVVGGGHNGLVAAAYLARAGHAVTILERLDHAGGAAISGAVFPGVDARLSRYSYLVSLLPDRIVSDLGLDIELRSRAVASYTPVGAGGLLVEREPGPETAESFRRLTGSDSEYEAWNAFYDEVSELADGFAPTMLEPLRSYDEIRELLGAERCARFLERPLGEVVESTFADDTVRGVVLTDGLIGTFSHAHDPSLLQNKCFLYHLIGNGTGEWRVPVGGMGAVTGALVDAARSAGARIVTNATVTAVEADGERAEVRYIDANGERQNVSASYVVSGVAPATLDALLGRMPRPEPEGAQVKLNMVVTRLPRLRSGVEPERAFAGTFHIDEGYGQLGKAYDDAANGTFPSDVPSEIYCHTLTDPSILAPELVERGWHTLTLFGLHTPVRLFARAAAPSTDELAGRYLAALNAYLEEPIEDCLATDADGLPCVELKTPLDIARDLGMPGGHIFHGDLAWPWAERPEQVGHWGVETELANVLICGSGSRRGGGVSGIGGHNAAHALLARMR